MQNELKNYSVIVRVKVVQKRTVVGEWFSTDRLLFRTTFTRTITLYELLGSNYLQN